MADNNRDAKTWGKIFKRAPEPQATTHFDVAADGTVRDNRPITRPGDNRGGVPSFVAFDEAKMGEHLKALDLHIASVLRVDATKVDPQRDEPLSVRTLIDAVDRLKTTLMANPEQVEQIRAAAENDPELAGRVEVVASKFVEPGTVIAMKRGVLDATPRGDLG